MLVLLTEENLSVLAFALASVP